MKLRAVSDAAQTRDSFKPKPHTQNMLRSQLTIKGFLAVWLPAIRLACGQIPCV